MLSTPSYFKLKSQLRLAAEYDPSTCIEFELRCNSAASNLRYKTVLPHSSTPLFSQFWHGDDLGHRVREFTTPITVWLAIQRKPHHRAKRATAARLPAYGPARPDSVEPNGTDGAPALTHLT